jgi:hypothetical protein
MRIVDPKLEIASGLYDLEKKQARRNGMPHAVTVAIIERQLRFKYRSLCNYRANYYSRKRVPNE